MAETGETRDVPGTYKSVRPKHRNALALQKSPYLQQHAHNPVDWMPWSEDAFIKAKNEDKPIFLSIGYSTCHWCHVMERESFEDEDVADILNRHFISIKVDREERPDIDSIYMTACQMMTGSGGWPLTIIMTPDKKPFFAGTYFPPEDRFNLRGIKSILLEISSVWASQRPEVEHHAQSVAQLVKNVSAPKDKARLDSKIMERSFKSLESQYDSKYGGFGAKGPKFPTPHNYSFLLRQWKSTGNKRIIEITEQSLQKIAGGGIHDHIGGGFHRYSVDREWLVPHFEKMLYDQALLARAYLETYQATGKKEYAESAKDVFDYVLRDMTDKAGGFYSAEDADSAGGEGRFYVWKKSEIDRILGKDAEIFNAYYGVTEKGNFEGGTNILHVAGDPGKFAAARKIGISRLEEILSSSRVKLIKERNKRKRPHRDEKIIASWNGLMISSLAYGAQVLDDPEYAKAASRAADFALSKLMKKGVLYRRYSGGEVAVQGFLDDYAFLAMGLTDLYEATFDLRRLEQAIMLTDEMIKLYWDDKSGGFNFSGNNNEKMIGEVKSAYDGAEPSGNSVAAIVLLKLSRFTMDSSLENKARRTIESFSSQIIKYPEGHTQMLIALDFMIGPSMEVVIAGDTGDPIAEDMIRLVRSEFLPNKITVFYPTDKPAEKIERMIPLTEFKEMKDGLPTAFVCRDFTCKFPTTDIIQLKDLLTGKIE